MRDKSKQLERSSEKPKVLSNIQGIVISKDEKIAKLNFGFFKALQNRVYLKLNVDLADGDR
jgi:hypothetical protein